MCEAIAETSGLDAAPDEVSRVLTGRSSDPARDELNTWLTWRQHAAARVSPTHVITHPRLARPRGRVNADPYFPAT
ncbi:hypothetical protein [uncultured Pseudokineococcus sp.]|uniref:hypothetical protein n=1 Tax=uncultured Pseudokineococcus sp. TaxID=1642928 RepID=UPI00262CA6A5|nr:hypothetical protein [uncultured Pseudokineococcus sp.]